MDVNTSELLRFFEEPGAHLLLDHDFTIRDVGPEYLRTTYTKREDIIGRSVLEIVDDSTHREYNGSLRHSLAKVVQTKQPDKMPVQQYDIRRRTGDGERTERMSRWLKVTNIPLVHAGELTGIVQRIEDVTLERNVVEKMRALQRRTYGMYALVLAIAVVAAYASGQALHQQGEIRGLVHRVANDEGITCTGTADAYRAAATRALQHSKTDIGSQRVRDLESYRADQAAAITLGAAVPSCKTLVNGTHR